MGYERESYTDDDVAISDTRRFGGLRERILWAIRRELERRLAYSIGDSIVYTVRALAHEDDPLHRTYRYHEIREKLWLRFVWRPLARKFGVETDGEDLRFNDSIPGNKAIAEFLNDNSYLHHSSAGGNAIGWWVEWFSIEPAPWSGQREDWLLWVDEEGFIEADGPMHPFVARQIFEDFKEQSTHVFDTRMADAYSAAGMEYDYPLITADGEPDYYEPDIFRASVAAASLAAAEDADIMDWYADQEELSEEDGPLPDWDDLR